MHCPTVLSQYLHVVDYFISGQTTGAFALCLATVARVGYFDFSKVNFGSDAMVARVDHCGLASELW